jgi:hypothetical protein
MLSVAEASMPFLPPEGAIHHSPLYTLEFFHKSAFTKKAAKISDVIPVQTGIHAF